MKNQGRLPPQSFEKLAREQLVQGTRTGLVVLKFEALGSVGGLLGTKLSIVTPAFNEEMNLELFVREVLSVEELSEYDLEIVIVNDGSKDRTWEVIQRLSVSYSSVVGVNLTKNCGHAAALEAGLNCTTGDLIVMMDADLQHPPSLIPELLAEYSRGFDVVNTVRNRTDGVSIWKRMSSSAYYKLLNGVSELHLENGEADFRLISKEVREALIALPETPKFYRGLIPWLGFPISRVSYDAPARINGQSSFTFSKMLELARLGVTSFSMKPLKFIFGLGVALTASSFTLLSVMIAVKLFVSSAFFSNIALLIVFIVLLVGLVVFVQGIVALYLVDLNRAAANRPSYVIKEINRSA